MFLLKALMACTNMIGDMSNAKGKGLFTCGPTSPNQHLNKRTHFTIVIRSGLWSLKNRFKHNMTNTISVQKSYQVSKTESHWVKMMKQEEFWIIGIT